MKVLVFLLAAAFASALPAADKPYAPESLPGATIVSAEEVVAMILDNRELVVIDSRKKPEYIKGHIEGAVNILNTELDLAALEAIAPARNAALLFYCNGMRCLRSADSITRAVGCVFPALPTTYIIDPDGKVVAGEVGLVSRQDLEEYIAGKAAEKIPAGKAGPEARPGTVAVYR